MKITAEEFKMKLQEKEFASCDPSLLEKLLPKGQILEYIDKSDFSIQAKTQLKQFLNTITMLREEGKYIGRSVMIVGDDNLAEMVMVVQSILVEIGVSTNILYGREARNKPIRFDSTIDAGFIEVSLSPRELERRYDSDLFFENYSENFVIYKGTGAAADFFLKKSGYLFPFKIVDHHTKEEKLDLAKKICAEYSFCFVNDISNPNLDSISHWGFKKTLNSLIMDALMTGKDDKVIKLSTILRPTNEHLASQMSGEDFEEDSNINQNHENISIDDLIGLSGVKKQIKRLCTFLAKKNVGISSKHMFFTGNPGTGKTTMARCLQQSLFENGVIEKNIFVETDKGGLCGRYVGHTAQKTKQIFDKARGGVLFIDEAYALAANIDERKVDFGYEAISTLLKLMEDNRDSTIVIMAGYPDEMKNMLSVNPGLKSRIQFFLDFPNYNAQELLAIFERILQKNSYSLSLNAKTKILKIFDNSLTEPDFSNGRFARNLCEHLMLIQCERADDNIITLEDVEQYLSELPKKKEKPNIGFSF
jgi:AAA+ superfamily predicted ATPase